MEVRFFVSVNSSKLGNISLKGSIVYHCLREHGQLLWDASLISCCDSAQNRCIQTSFTFELSNMFGIISAAKMSEIYCS